MPFYFDYILEAIIGLIIDRYIYPQLERMMSIYVTLQYLTYFLDIHSE